MSAKKSFKENNPALSFISSVADQTEPQEQPPHIPQDTPQAHNTQEVQHTADPVSKTTQGKKGQKLPRINMAFSTDNLAHIQLMGRVMGCSATEYVNRLIEADRNQRGETVAAALKLFEEVNNK